MNRLERSLQRAAEDEGQRKALRRALHESRVCLPLTGAEQGEDGKIALRFLVEMRGNRPYVLAFSDERKVGVRFGKDQPAVNFTGAELTEFWNATDWLVLDPGEAHAAVFAPLEIRSLPNEPPEGLTGIAELDPANLVAPRPDDSDVLQALRTGLADRQGIEQLVALRYEVEGDPVEWVLVVDLADDAEPPVLARAIIDAAAAAGIEGEVVVAPATEANASAVEASGVRLL